jgi:hypothetical protein
MISNTFCDLRLDDDDISIFVFQDNQSIDITKKTNYTLKDLKANTSYTVQIQYITSHGEGARSDPITFRTDDERN